MFMGDGLTWRMRWRRDEPLTRREQRCNAPDFENSET